MTRKYFNLLRPYQAHYGEPQWVLHFPPWTPSEHDLYSQELLAPRWNPRLFAFSSVLPPTDHAETVGKLDFPAIPGEWHGCSRKMAAVIDSVAPGCIEFLPFRTRTSTGDDVTDTYSLMHYLQWAPAVDGKKSQLMEGETRLRRVAGTGKDYLLDRVVLSQKKLVEPICRVVGWSPFHLYREDVVAALKKEELTGLEFEEVAVV